MGPICDELASTVFGFLRILFKFLGQNYLEQDISEKIEKYNFQEKLQDSGI